MLRCGRKEICILLAVLCVASLCLNIFNKMGTWYMPADRPVDRRQVHLELRQITSNNSQNAISSNQTELAQSEKSSLQNTTSTSADSTVATSNATVQTLTVTNWCPEKSPHLVGALAALTKEVTPQYLMESFPELEKGGRIRPTDCTPRQRVALVIPYRNRYPHIHIMLHNLLPILKRQQADVTFFVIEQAPPEVFNRGALLNIGVLEAEKLATFDCYIFHDADMIPLHDHNLYRCGDQPRHFAVAMNKFNYKLPYAGYFGAVAGFSKEQLLTINGCSNVYFGWGGEDDDLFYRIRNKKYKVSRYAADIARYHMISHNLDLGNEVNPVRSALIQNCFTRQDVEGLNSTKYTLNSVRQEKLYTWINVSLNMTEILLTAPKQTIEIINRALAPSKKIIQQTQDEKH